MNDSIFPENELLVHIQGGFLQKQCQYVSGGVE